MAAKMLEPLLPSVLPWLLPGLGAALSAGSKRKRLDDGESVRRRLPFGQRRKRKQERKKRRRILPRIGHQIAHHHARTGPAPYGRSFGGGRRRRRTGRGLSKRVRRNVKGMIGSALGGCTNAIRNVDSGQIVITANQCNYSNFGFLGRSDIETHLGETETMYKDAGGVGYAQLDVGKLAGMKTKLLNARKMFNFRNNGHMPVKLQVWWTQCINDTDEAIVSTMTSEGATIDGLGGTFSITDPRYYPWDTNSWTKMWKVFKHRKYMLQGGDEVDINMNRWKPYLYDYTTAAHATQLSYIKGLSQMILIRFEGVTSHDQTTTTNVGLGDGTIDYVIREHYKYDVQNQHRYKRLIEKSGDFDALSTPVVTEPTLEETKLDV